MAQSEITFLYGKWVSDCTHHIDKHFEGYYTLQYMAGGGVDLRIGGQSYALLGRWFWSCWPGPQITFHAGAGARTWEHRYLAFRGVRVARWAAEGLFPIRPQQPPTGEDWGARFDAILDLALRPDAWNRRRAVHLLEGVLIELAEARAQPATGPTWLQEVVQELEARVETAAPDYARLAGRVDMSLTTLRRKFRAATGMSLHEYLLQLRIHAAQRLLAETDLPIKTVADRLGYRDVFYFTRQFRVFTGVPPAVYRQSTAG